MHWKQKRVQTRGHSLQTYTLGEGEETILLIHGGPGAPSDYLRESHAFLAAEGYKLVTWDQLGCGNSDKPDDSSLWTLPRYVEEIEDVRKALNLDYVHLLGTAWGGMLAIEYALYHPHEVASLALVSTSPSASLLQESTVLFKKQLHEIDPEKVEEALAKRHFCRLPVWPKSLAYSKKAITTPILNTLYGPDLFHLEGSLKDWERVRDLYWIHQPALVLHGEHNYPLIAEITQSNLPNSRFEIFKKASRTPYFETPRLYQNALIQFYKYL